MFVRSLQRRSANHNYSLHTQRVFTQDWLNSFWSCLLYCRVNSLINAPEGNSINANILFLLLYLCNLFTDILALFVVACPLVYHFFYTDVVAVFLFIHWSCKQIHCFVFEAFVYHFNNIISIFVAILLRFYLFKNRLIWANLLQTK